MKPRRTCPLCGGSTGLPHASEIACFRGVDMEIKAALGHLRVLTRRKSELLRLRVHRRRSAIAARRRERQ